ncbi:MAG: HAD-IIA family hydrolase [Anaerolineae bacterium]
MHSSNVAAVLLAAGGSTRLGRPKQLLEWEGRPLIVHVADTAWMAELHPLVVVVGSDGKEAAAALEDRSVQILHNYRWEEGMSTSLRVGLSAIASSEAAIFLQVDQPFITSHFLQALVERWRETGADIVVPTWKGRRGSPVLIGRDLFPELATISGDVGGRFLFETYADRLVTLAVEDPLLLADIDRPEDYERLRAEQRAPHTAERLNAVRALVCDMDGVLWRGDTPLPGLQEFFEFVREQDLSYTLVTNNASRTPEEYVEKLAGMGVETTTDHVLNSALAAADHLADLADPGTPVYPIGGAGVHEALKARGFRLSEEKADYVVVGWDPDLTWKKIARATRFIYEGAGFIGTNPDRTFPSEEGPLPGAGAQLAMLEAATGVHPTVAGKPEPILYRQALARMDSKPEETLMIGDRLDTDILGALRLGMPTVLVLSGIQKHEDLPRSPIRPDLVFENLAVLVEAWRKENG